MWSIIRPMRSGEPRNIMPPPMPWCMPPMPWCMPPMPWRSPPPCMPPIRAVSPRGGAAISGPLPGGGGAGCDHADRLSAASSVITMPIITHLDAARGRCRRRDCHCLAHLIAPSPDCREMAMMVTVRRESSLAER